MREKLIEDQRHLFSLDEREVYLNCARMGPIPLATQEVGLNEVRRRANPSQISSDEFFSLTEETRELFNKLIRGNDPSRVVIAPATSYIVSTVARALHPKNGTILLTEHQFPSNYYPWKRMAQEKGLLLDVVQRVEGQDYTQTFLDKIDHNTAIIALEPINWGDGLHIDIKSIGDKAKEVGAFYLIDGTQYIGAHPYIHSSVEPDVLVVSAYKWLLSPYGMAVAYLGPKMDDKMPLEDGWLNRSDSQDFQHLTKYQDQYRPKARRFEVGEAPDMIRVPMLNSSLKQILEWGPTNIKAYLSDLVSPYNEQLLSMGFHLLVPDHRCPHLYGIGLPAGIELEDVKQKLAKEKISVSFRNEVIRVSPNVYNTRDDMSALVDVLRSLR